MYVVPHIKAIIVNVVLILPSGKLYQLLMILPSNVVSCCKTPISKSIIKELAIL